MISRKVGPTRYERRRLSKVSCRTALPLPEHVMCREASVTPNTSNSDLHRPQDASSESHLTLSIIVLHLWLPLALCSPHSALTPPSRSLLAPRQLYHCRSGGSTVESSCPISAVQQLIRVNHQSPPCALHDPAYKIGCYPRPYKHYGAFE